jgi:oligosaccharide 4-alpha-D-glucosyltransferase
MMVAPVITQGSTSRTVLFPSGKWISYWNASQEYEGGTSATVSAALDVLPLFIRAGSFIPMVPPLNTLAHYNTDTLIVRYYPELSVPQSSCRIYDDDGADPDALANLSYDLITLEGSVDWHQITVTLSSSGNGFVGAPLQREMRFEFQRILDAPTQVLLDGIDLPFKSSLAEFGAADSAVYFDGAADVLYVHFKWNGDPSVLELLNSVLSGMEAPVSETAGRLEIFPNPASDQAVVVFNLNAAGTISIEVFPVSGKSVSRNELSAKSGRNEYTLELSQLPAGIYFVRVKNGNEFFEGKLVRQ